MKELTLNDLNLARAAEQDPNDELAAKATMYARYAMADVEFALAQLGMSMTADQYQTAFKAMMVRKAKNEVRKYNAS